MKRARLAAVVLASCGLVAGVALLATTAYDAAAQVPSAAPSALPPIVGAVVLPPLAKRSIPSEKSEAPANDAWATAEEIAPTRKSLRARACTLHVVREYARISCPQLTAGIRQYAGSGEDVRLFAVQKSNGPGAPSMWDAPNGGHITLPLRRGAGYVFQFHEIDQGYDGFGVSSGVLVDVAWPESQPGPSVVLR